ncbi:hypothetical protein CSKR_105940 [Clonorchis sinensis]|uniref:Uncharacterized protein n=1 Tax=Clonorchis sinensis TaxID=79923 RepID=A0A419Q3E2_CLOSI|nr:hypothetical protein CSKR_105940 [Clonorchis sinensis]
MVRHAQHTPQPKQFVVLDTFLDEATRCAIENSLSNCLVTGSSTPIHTGYGSETKVVEHLKKSQFHVYLARFDDSTNILRYCEIVDGNLDNITTPPVGILHCLRVNSCSKELRLSVRSHTTNITRASSFTHCAQLSPAKDASPIKLNLWLDFTPLASKPGNMHYEHAFYANFPITHIVLDQRELGPSSRDDSCQQLIRRNVVSVTGSVHRKSDQQLKHRRGVDVLAGTSFLIVQLRRACQLTVSNERMAGQKEFCDVNSPQTCEVHCITGASLVLTSSLAHLSREGCFSNNLLDTYKHCVSVVSTRRGQCSIRSWLDTESLCLRVVAMYLINKAVKITTVAYIRQSNADFRETLPTYGEMLAICKGLHYTLWMQDKLLLKEEVVRRICHILPLIPHPTMRLHYINAMFETLAREWDRLDNWRLDKFMLLTRDFFTQALHSLVPVDREVWNHVLEAVFDKILNADIQHAVGLKMHMCTVLSEELSKKWSCPGTPFLLSHAFRHHAYAHNFLRVIHTLLSTLRRHSNLSRVHSIVEKKKKQGHISKPAASGTTPFIDTTCSVEVPTFPPDCTVPVTLSSQKESKSASKDEEISQTTDVSMSTSDPVNEHIQKTPHQTLCSVSTPVDSVDKAKRRVSFGKVFRKSESYQSFTLLSRCLGFIASQRLSMTPTVKTTPKKGILRACEENLVDLEYADDMDLVFVEEQKALVFLDELTKVIPSFALAEDFTPIFEQCGWEVMRTRSSVAFERTYAVTNLRVHRGFHVHRPGFYFICSLQFSFLFILEQRMRKSREQRTGMQNSASWGRLLVVSFLKCALVKQWYHHPIRNGEGYTLLMSEICFSNILL